MKCLQTRLWLTVFLLTSFSMPAYAYLDPGTGSLLFSALLGLATTIVLLGKTLLFKIKNLPHYFRNRGVGLVVSNKIIFYSEGGQYWNVFKPILEELSDRGVNCSYLTSAKDDPGMGSELSSIHVEYIGEGNKAMFALNSLQADIVVMTTPGLDVLQLKRSAGVKHYCHIMHGMEDPSTYAPFGIDYFDSIMVNGVHQEEVIRELEAVKSLPAKLVGIIGSTYLDVMAEKMGEIDTVEGRKTVLLAPSWGEKGFLTKYGERLISNLVNSDYNIIIRPHPQSFTSEKEFIERLQAKFSAYENLSWDSEHDAFSALSRSDIMISDFSGIIFDYMFLFSKPVVVANFDIDVRKYDMCFLAGQSSTLMRLMSDGEIGTLLDASDVMNVVDVVDQALSDAAESKNLEVIKDKVYCYPGESGVRGADFVRRLALSVNT